MKSAYLGFGLGLRSEHYNDVIEQRPNLDWFEIITENYLDCGGKPLFFLDQVRQDYPVAMHGVSLSIGAADPLDRNYLEAVGRLAARIEPEWISDHLCWTRCNGTQLHDLMPLPYTEEAIVHAADRVRQVQDILGRQLLLENLSSYVTFTHSKLSEWEFLSEIANRADCLILLDLNNIYVSSVNHEFDPLAYVHGVPESRVRQFHLAGHSRNAAGTLLIDTHDQPVPAEVWQVYRAAVRHFGPISTMIERDDNMPPLAELMNELTTARDIYAEETDPRLLTASVL